jgi:hypothetical protein
VSHGKDQEEEEEEEEGGGGDETRARDLNEKKIDLPTTAFALRNELQKESDKGFSCKAPMRSDGIDEGDSAVHTRPEVMVRPPTSLLKES